jgi:hypothetical protein
MTTIHFRIFDRAAGDLVQVSIRTVTGQEVRALAVPADWLGSVAWDGLDSQGREVASGVYLARVRLGALSVVRRMVVLR